MKDIYGKNDNGELERIDHSSTYVGTATLQDGTVVEKTFRTKSSDDAVKRWLEWQGKAMELKPKPEPKQEQLQYDEPVKSPNAEPEPKSKQGITELFAYLSRIANALEIIALNTETIELKADINLVTTESEQYSEEIELRDSVELFLEGKSIFDFINKTTSQVAKEYFEFCKDGGFEARSQRGFTKKVLSIFGDELALSKPGNRHNSYTYKFNGGKNE